MLPPGEKLPEAVTKCPAVAALSRQRLDWILENSLLAWVSPPRPHHSRGEQGSAIPGGVQGAVRHANSWKLPEKCPRSCGSFWAKMSTLPEAGKGKRRFHKLGLVSRSHVTVKRPLNGIFVVWPLWQ